MKIREGGWHRHGEFIPAAVESKGCHQRCKVKRIKINSGEWFLEEKVEVTDFGRRGMNTWAA